MPPGDLAETLRGGQNNLAIVERLVRRSGTSYDRLV